VNFCYEQIEVEVADQFHNEVLDMRSRIVRDLEEENGQLLLRMNQLELEIKRRKAEKKIIQNAHEEEIRSRDRKEILFLMILACCLGMYLGCTLVV
jgi:hypothetical protein